MMTNSNCETVLRRQMLVTAASVEVASPGGGRLEAHEFESMLRRAMKVLTARERSALVERSRLTNAADSAAPSLLE